MSAIADLLADRGAELFWTAAFFAALWLLARRRYRRPIDWDADPFDDTHFEPPKPDPERAARENH